MSENIKIYLAGPLFTQGEWQWNARLGEALRAAGLIVFLPQEKSAPMLNGSEEFDPEALFRNCISGVEDCDVVLAVLDQADPDSGTCWECGYAYKLGRPIIGLRTDIRIGGDDGGRPVNLMLARCCRDFILLPFGKRDDMPWLVQQIVKVVKMVAES